MDRTLDRLTCESTESYQHGSQKCPGSPLELAAWVGGNLLLGVGIPLIVVGARSGSPGAPKPAATVSTWANERGFGLGLRLNL